MLQLLYDLKDGDSFQHTSAQMAGKLDGDSPGVFKELLRRDALSAGHSYGARGNSTENTSLSLHSNWT